MEKNKREIVIAEQKHIDAMKGNMREADERECRAAANISAGEALQKGYDIAYLCWVGLLNGKPFSCFGVSSMSLLNIKGIPWMLGTDDIRRSKEFVRGNSRPYIEKILAPFQELENYVDVRNTISINWLKWCGFTIEAPEPFGYKQRLFHRFWMKKGSEYV